MIWFWMWEDDLPGQPDVIFDQARTGFPAYLLREPGEETGITGTIFFDVGRRTVSRLSRYLILPTAWYPLVRGDALQAFQALPSGEVDFPSTTVTCKDGEIDDFVLIRPKVECLCVDTENSDLDWVREGEYYDMWKRLSALPDNCMGRRSIVREKLNRQTVVSEQFKAILEPLDPKGVAFTAVEGSRRGYAKWVR